MRDETIAVHGGYDGDPTRTRAVAVPDLPDDRARLRRAPSRPAPSSICRPRDSTTTGSTTRRNRRSRTSTCRARGRRRPRSGGSGHGRDQLCDPDGGRARARNTWSPPSSTARPTPTSRTSSPTLGIEVASRRTTGPSRSPRRSTRTPARCSAKRSAIRPATSSTSRPSPTVAHAHGVPLIVDNTVATPLMLKPIEHGADVVMHSLTKFIGGHGTTLGGAIIDGGRFRWADHADRFPMFSEPEPAFHGVVFGTEFPDTAFVARARSIHLRNTGATLVALQRVPVAAGIWRPCRCDSNGTRATPARSPSSCATTRGSSGSAMPGSRNILPTSSASAISRAGCRRSSPSGPQGGYDAAIRFFDPLRCSSDW